MESNGLFAAGTIVVTIVIIVFSLVVAIVPLVLILRWMGKMKANNDQLLATGVPAQARIIQMGPTGLTVNDAPQLNITLEVHPPPAPGYRAAAAPFTATVQALVPVYAMPRIQPGQIVPVRFDPANPSRLTIDLRALGFA